MNGSLHLACSSSWPKVPLSIASQQRSCEKRRGHRDQSGVPLMALVHRVEGVRFVFACRRSEVVATRSGKWSTRRSLPREVAKEVTRGGALATTLANLSPVIFNMYRKEGFRIMFAQRQSDDKTALLSDKCLSPRSIPCEVSKSCP